MADITIDELENLTKSVTKTKKALDSSAITIIKGERDRKKRNELIKQYTELLEKQLKTDKSLNSFQKSAIRQQINESRNVTGKFALLAKAGKFAKDELAAFAKGLAATAVKFLDRETKVTGFSTIVEEVGGLTGKALKALAGSADFNRGVFKQLAMSGADFGKDVIALGEAANRARMPLLEFVDLVQSNATTFAGLFGTVQRGVNAVEGFTAELTDVTLNEFSQFGLNVQETNEFLATFLELERARGRTQQITQAQLIAGTAQYTRNLIKLTKLTGQEITAIDDNIRAQALDGQFQAKLAQLVAEGRVEEANRLRETAGALRGISPAFEQFFKDIVTTGTVTTETNQTLAGVSTDLFRTVQKFIGDPSISEADFISSIRKEGGEILRRSGLEVAAAFNPAIKEALDTAAAIAGVTETFNGEKLDLDKALQADLKARGEFARATTEIVKGLDATRLFQVGTQEVTLEGLKKLFGDGSALESINNFLMGGETMFQKANNLFGSLTEKGGALATYIMEFPGKTMQFLKKTKDLVVEDLTTDMNPDKEGFQFTNFDFLSGSRKHRQMKKLEKLKDMPALTPVMQDPDPVPTQTASLHMQTGSNGFQNFGDGTPAILHGMESVVPKNDFGQLLETLREMLPAATAGNAPEPVQTSNLGGDMNRLIDTLSKGNEQVVNSLNNLISVNITTERNTAKTANTVANMGGSVI